VETGGFGLAGLLATGGGGLGRGGILERSEVLEAAALETGLGVETRPSVLRGELREAFRGRFMTGGEAAASPGFELVAVFPETLFFLESVLSPLDGLELPLPLVAAAANFCCREEENTSLLRSLARESRESEVRSLVDPPPSDTTFSWPEVSMSDVSLERGAVEKSESSLFPDHGALGLRRNDEEEPQWG
jgi:hypothetical protein